MKLFQCLSLVHMGLVRRLNEGRYYIIIIIIIIIYLFRSQYVLYW
jgi:hypothetical protein